MDQASATVKIQNTTKRRYTLPARLFDDGEKFGGDGVGIDPKGTAHETVEIPRWYFAAMLEERSLGMLFVHRKLNLLGEDGEPVRVKLEHVSPKKVAEPRYVAPKPSFEFPKGQVDELRAQLELERDARFELEAKVDEFLRRAPTGGKGDSKLAKEVEDLRGANDELRAQLADLTKQIAGLTKLIDKATAPAGPPAEKK